MSVLIYYFYGLALIVVGISFSLTLTIGKQHPSMNPYDILSEVWVKAGITICNTIVHLYRQRHVFQESDFQRYVMKFKL